MGLTNWLKSASRFLSETGFQATMEKLGESDNAETTVFSNVRRIDNRAISAYYINKGMQEGEPVFLLSDSGKIVMLSDKIGSDALKRIVPPYPGEYIVVGDNNKSRQDFISKHYSFVRDVKTLSDTVLAFYYDEKESKLYCSKDAEAVKNFKKLYLES